MKKFCLNCSMFTPIRNQCLQEPSKPMQTAPLDKCDAHRFISMLGGKPEDLVEIQDWHEITDFRDIQYSVVSNLLYRTKDNKYIAWELPEYFRDLIQHTFNEGFQKGIKDFRHTLQSLIFSEDEDI